MRYFLISFSALLMSCASYPKKNDLTTVENTPQGIINPYFSDMDRDYVYKAKIAFAKKTFGGLFVVKKLGEDHHRIVFTTEMGNKLLDFSFEGDRFKINYILEEMNRKMLINLLKKDFYVLIDERPPVLHQYTDQGGNALLETKLDKDSYFYSQHDQNLEKIIRTRKGRERTIYSFSRGDDHWAKQIIIEHTNIPLNIHLTSL